MCNIFKIEQSIYPKMCFTNILNENIFMSNENKNVFTVGKERENEKETHMR